MPGMTFAMTARISLQLIEGLLKPLQVASRGRCLSTWELLPVL
jgi:hypothetical protein